MTDRQLDGLRDESDDVQKERKYPMNWTFQKICPAILVHIVTMNLGSGWMDRTEDGKSSRWNHVWVARQMSHATDIQMDLSCY